MNWRKSDKGFSTYTHKKFSITWATRCPINWLSQCQNCSNYVWNWLSRRPRGEEIGIEWGSYWRRQRLFYGDAFSKGWGNWKPGGTSSRPRWCLCCATELTIKKCWTRCAYQGVQTNPAVKLGIQKTMKCWKPKDTAISTHVKRCTVRYSRS